MTIETTAGPVKVTAGNLARCQGDIKKYNPQSAKANNPQLAQQIAGEACSKLGIELDSKVAHDSTPRVAQHKAAISFLRRGCELGAQSGCSAYARRMEKDWRDQSISSAEYETAVQLVTTACANGTYSWRSDHGFYPDGSPVCYQAADLTQARSQAGREYRIDDVPRADMISFLTLMARACDLGDPEPLRGNLAEAACKVFSTKDTWGMEEKCVLGKRKAACELLAAFDPTGHTLQRMKRQGAALEEARLDAQRRRENRLAAQEQSEREERLERRRNADEERRRAAEDRKASVDAIVSGLNQATVQIQQQNAAIHQHQSAILQQQDLRDHARIQQQQSEMLARQAETAGAVSGRGRTAQNDDASDTQEIASACNTQCARLKSECASSQSACYRAAACQCQCFLDKAPASSPSRSQWRQCVTDNTAKAETLKSDRPVFDPYTKPAPGYVQQPSSSGTPAKGCPGGRYPCAEAAR